MRYPRSNPHALTLDDGRVFVSDIGEFLSAGTDSGDFFDSATNRFLPARSISGKVEDRLRILNDKVAPTSAPEKWVFVFQDLKRSLGKRIDSSSIALPNGLIVVCGGAYPSTKEKAMHIPTADISLYDPKTHKLQSVGRLQVPRCSAALTLLKDDSLLVTGGYSYGPLATCELINTKTYKSSFAPPLKVPRYNHSSVLLPDGSVMVSGGENVFLDKTANTSIASVELLPPNGQRFHLIGEMNSRRRHHASSLLRDGRVLICGGENSHEPSEWTPLSSAEICELRSINTDYR